MIEIIKEGKKDPERGIGICDKCECEFSYSREDTLSQRGIYTINCPCCNRLLILEVRKDTIDAKENIQHKGFKGYKSKQTESQD